MLRYLVRSSAQTWREARRGSGSSEDRSEIPNEGNYNSSIQKRIDIDF